MLHPADTVAIFQKQPGPHTFTAGQTIFTQGETGNVMYGILSGDVEMLVNGRMVETLTQGDIFGEGALIHSDHLRYSTAIAKTDCILACLDMERFLFAIEQTPMFAIQVMRSYSDRLRRIKQLF